MFGFWRKIRGSRTKEEKRIRDVFSKIVLPEAVEDLLSDTSLRVDRFRPSHLGVILVMVGGADVSEIAAGVGRIMEATARHEAMVWSIVGPLVSLSMGSVNDQRPQFDPEAFNRLLTELVSLDSVALKLLHWQGTAHAGLVGGKNGMVSYNLVFPEFERMMGALCRLEFGAVAEFKGEILGSPA